MPHDGRPRLNRSMSWKLGLFLATALAWSPAFPLARMAIVMGENVGLYDEKPLSYATRDAEQVYATLQQLGGMDPGRGMLMLDPSVAQVRTAFRDVGSRIAALRGQGQKVQLLIYYSGHGSDNALHMKGDKLPLDDIRAYFKDLAADLKLLIADACFSGALIQKKGADLADPVPIHYVDELKVNGSAILTSSSAGELSQESRELQGSLFTYYFLSAVRGAADLDHDGQVTLWEAYNHTMQNLRRRLAIAANAAQHPEFDVDLHGSDNLVLTRLNMGQALLGLKGLPLGVYKVMEAVSSLEVAEVNIADPEGMTLALPKAPYLVYRRDGKQGLAGYADLRRSRSVELGPGDFTPVALGALTAKGSMSLRGMQRAVRGPFQLSVEPRFYPSFPGRDLPAPAFGAAAQGNWRDLGLLAAVEWLPTGRSSLDGNRFEQDGLGVAGEIRYYWSYSRLGAAFAGPRGELWSLGQKVNGKDVGRGSLTGTFAAVGLEKILAASLSFSVSAEAGLLWSYDGGGHLRRTLTFPLSLSLRYGT